MPLVKSVWVRLSESGAAEVKAQLGDVAARAQLLSKMDPTVKIKAVIDKGGFAQLRALRIELAALTDLGDKANAGAFRNLAAGFRQIGDDAQGARLKAAALGLELRAIRGLAAAGAGGDQGGGFLSRLLGSLGSRAVFGKAGAGLAGLFGAAGQAGAAGAAQSGAAGAGGFLGTPIGAIGATGVTATAITLLATGIGGIVPALAAAGLGVASFGALAYPTFQKVAAAVKLSGDKLRDLPPGLRGAVTAVQGVMGTFSGLARAIGPQVLPVIRDLAPGIKQLVGDMGPFAHAVAPVLDSLAKSFSKFTMSAGFKQFLDQMLKLSGPALLTIGQGLGRVVIAIGKLLEALINPNGIKALRVLFTTFEWAIQGIAAIIKWATPLVIREFAALAQGTRDIGRWAVDAWHIWIGAWHGITGAISAAGNFIDRVLTVDIPHAGAVLLTWFSALPGKAVSALSNLGSMLFGVGQAAIQGLWNGLQSIAGSILSWISGFASSIWSAAKGALGIHSPSTKFYSVGLDIMGGLEAGMKRGSRNVLNVAAALGISISDKLMDAFMSRNDKRADAAGTAIAAILRARLEQIRAYIVGIAQQEVAWASIVSAATGPAFSTPRWIGPHWVRGHPGQPGSVTFSHTGAPTGTPGSGGTRGHWAAGHWAGGNAPPTGAQLLRNLNLDLGRLRQFAHVMARLRRMGLDPVLWNQILAAGPDQGYQIAEAILDAGRGEIWQLNRAENQIYQTGVGLGRTGARVGLGANVNNNFYFNGLIAGNPRAIAREIQKLLADLKRHNGGAALGLA